MAYLIEHIANLQGPPVSVFTRDNVATCLEVLRETGFLSLLIVDETQKPIGLIDTVDLVAFLAKIIPETSQEAVAGACERFLTQNVGELADLSGRNPPVPAPASTPLSQALLMLQTGIHRIPVTDEGGEQCIGVLSQTDVIKYYAGNPGDLGGLVERTISSLGIGSPCKGLDAGTALVDAFRILANEGLSGVPLMNGEAMVANLSASDVKGLSPDNWQLLLGPAMDYLPEHSRAPLCVAPSATFGEILMLLTQVGIHRIYVTDGVTPSHVITLTDIIAEIVKVVG
eukprot:GFYU01017784.1.p1 GENE.GFYU01017784.1~~GFYU01017784.1.p1  ORF type:complete len:285 (-),score=59.93 GFYU01017784.1:46-900(-)